MLPDYLQQPSPEWYDHLGWYALDFETTNVEKGDPWVRGNRLVACAVAHQSSRAEIVKLGEIADHLPKMGVLVAQNAKFELAWLLREGVDTTNLLPWDTMLAEYVIAGNRRVALDLGSIAKRYGIEGKEPVVDRLIKAGLCPSEIPRGWLESRVLYDTSTTMAIARKQHEILKRDGLMPVFFTRCIVTPVLAAIEQYGMHLDGERVEAEYAKVATERAQLEDALAKITGGINLRSGKQLAEFLYDKIGFQEATDRRGNPVRTQAGKRSTGKAVLEKLEAKTKEQREFVKLRAAFGKADARITKSLDFFRRVCREHSESFRARFNQAVTQTHRLSSSGRRVRFADGKELGVQFQNLPREYKPLFRASDDGRVLVEVDGAQLEFRVAGHLGRDAQVLADVQGGADIHRFTASVLGHKDESEVTDADRTAAKAHTFKPLYGGNSGTKRELEYYAAFRTKYKGVFDTQTAWTHEVLNTGKLRTATGLIFYWPATKMKEGGYIENTPSIFNYPVQSLATADIIPISLVYTYWGAKHLDVKIVNTVHDSVVADVAEEDVESYREIVKDAWMARTYNFLDKVYDIKMQVPLGLEMKVATHWGATKQSMKFSQSHEEATDGR